MLYQILRSFWYAVSRIKKTSDFLKKSDVWVPKMGLLCSSRVRDPAGTFQDLLWSSRILWLRYGRKLPRPTQPADASVRSHAQNVGQNSGPAAADVLGHADAGVLDLVGPRPAGELQNGLDDLVDSGGPHGMAPAL